MLRNCPDDRPVRWLTEIMYQAAPCPRSLLTMDDVDATACEATAEDYEEWRQWLMETFRAHEEEWFASGDLRYEAGGPWLQHVAFDPCLHEAQNALHRATRWGTGGIGYNWRDRFSAGLSGCYWKMVPVYDGRQKGALWSAMQRELFVTSVFNLGATREQDGKLWERMEERFPAAYQHMSRYHYLIRWREQRVLDWSRARKTVTEMANLLVDEGLHPINTDPFPADPPPEGEEREGAVESARRLVMEIRRRLRAQGLIERGKPGRPRKSAPKE